MDHFVLTRFNPRIAGRSVSDDWMSRRLSLFKSVCLPSVRTQACSWLVFFDARTIPIWRDRIDELDGFEPVFIDSEFNANVAAQHVQERRKHDVVITTRLDNDDGLSTGFCGHVQRIASSGFRGCVDFPLGIQRRDNKAYLRITRGSPFLSMVEDDNNLRTVYSVEHWAPPAPVKRVVRIGWQQMLHENNLANTVRGVRVPRRLATIAGRLPGDGSTRPLHDEGPTVVPDSTGTTRRLPE